MKELIAALELLAETAVLAVEKEAAVSGSLTASAYYRVMDVVRGTHEDEHYSVLAVGLAASLTVPGRTHEEVKAAVVEKLAEHLAYSLRVKEETYRYAVEVEA